MKVRSLTTFAAVLTSSLLWGCMCGGVYLTKGDAWGFLQNANGEPVTGATVRLYKTVEDLLDDRAAGNDKKAAYTTTTAAPGNVELQDDGYFEFVGVKTRMYVMDVIATGYSEYVQENTEVAADAEIMINSGNVLRVPQTALTNLTVTHDSVNYVYDVAWDAGVYAGEYIVLARLGAEPTLDINDYMTVTNNLNDQIDEWNFWGTSGWDGAAAPPQVKTGETIYVNVYTIGDLSYVQRFDVAVKADVLLGSHTDITKKTVVTQ